MLPIIFGTKTYYKDLGEIILPCPHCGNTSTFKTQLWTRRHHIYYAPLSKIAEGYIFTCNICQKQIGIFEDTHVKHYTDMLAANGGIVCLPEIAMLVKLTNVIKPQTVSGDIQQMTATYKAMPPLGKAIVIAFTIFMVACLPVI